MSINGAVALGSRCIAWLLLLALVLITLSPIEWRPTSGTPAHFERFAAFAVLGAAFSLGYPKHRFKALIFLVVFTGVLEALQYLVPGRHGRTYDAAVKVFGAAVGVFVTGQLATWFGLTADVCPDGPEERQAQEYGDQKR